MAKASELINRPNTICHYKRFSGFSEANCNACNVGAFKMVELLHLFAENGLAVRAFARTTTEAKGALPRAKVGNGVTVRCLLPETFRLVVGNGITGAPAMTIPAKYEDGVFRPLEIVQMKEGTVVEVLVPAEQEPARKRRSIKDLPFYGMWKDRTDIGDGVDYVNKLRDNPRG
jgi:predicted DNA-binding antitoxin AbrB/MazE fold protein